MENLNWNKKYSVGVYEIDAEHKIFLKTIKKLDKAFENQLDLDILKRLLTELYKYADFHFTSEENVMLTCNYPDFETHQNQHIELMQNLADTINFTEIERINKTELIEFLVRWFKEHTTSADLKLGKFLQAEENKSVLTEFEW